MNEGTCVKIPLFSSLEVISEGFMLRCSAFVIKFSIRLSQLQQIDCNRFHYLLQFVFLFCWLTCSGIFLDPQNFHHCVAFRCIFKMHLNIKYLIFHTSLNSRYVCTACMHTYRYIYSLLYIKYIDIYSILYIQYIDTFSFNQLKPKVSLFCNLSIS